MSVDDAINANLPALKSGFDGMKSGAKNVRDALGTIGRSATDDKDRQMLADVMSRPDAVDRALDQLKLSLATVHPGFGQGAPTVGGGPN